MNEGDSEITTPTKILGIIVLLLIILFLIAEISSTNKNTKLCASVGMSYDISKMVCYKQTGLNPETGKYDYKYAEVPK